MRRKFPDGDESRIISLTASSVSVFKSLFNEETASVCVCPSSKHRPFVFLLRTLKRRFVLHLDFGEVIFWFVLEGL